MYVCMYEGALCFICALLKQFHVMYVWTHTCVCLNVCTGTINIQLE